MKKNAGVAYSGLVGKNMRFRASKFTTRQSPVQKTINFCVSGPMRGFSLALQSDCRTLVFSMNGDIGRYVGGIWESWK